MKKIDELIQAIEENIKEYEIKKDKHIWNIKKENNDITFSISKSEKTKTSVFSTIHIIGLVLLAVLGIIGLILYRKFTQFTNSIGKISLV